MAFKPVIDGNNSEIYGHIISDSNKISNTPVSCDFSASTVLTNYTYGKTCKPFDILVIQLKLCLKLILRSSAIDKLIRG